MYVRWFCCIPGFDSVAVAYWTRLCVVYRNDWLAFNSTDWSRHCCTLREACTCIPDFHVKRSSFSCFPLPSSLFLLGSSARSFGSYASFFWSSLHRLRGRYTLLLLTGDLTVLTPLLSVILLMLSLHSHLLFSVYLLCPPRCTSVLFRHSLFGLSTRFPESFFVFSFPPSPIIFVFRCIRFCFSCTC